MRHTLSVSLGALALLATVAVMAVLIVLTVHIPKESSGRTLSQVSVALEAVTLFIIGWFLSTYPSTSFRSWSTRCLGVDFGAAVLTILFATVATVATLIQFSKSTLKNEDDLANANKNSLLIGLSVALGLCFMFQAGFLSVHFFLTRRSDQQAFSLHTLEEGRSLPSYRSKSSLKTLRYSHTASDRDPMPRKMTSMDFHTPASSIRRGRSRSGTASSIKAQLSNAIRSATVKSHVSSSEFRRPITADSTAYQSSEDAFDTWDTSSVDTHNREVVEATTPPPQKTQGHFLETIPGSPSPSRTSTPHDVDMPLEPPRIMMRSRSYSPVSIRREQLNPESSLTDLPEPSLSESHIHPLFRSDSPTPPPMATPGTVVVASPNAGQVITHRQSVRSLRSTSVSVHPHPLAREEQDSIMEEQEVETDSRSSGERPLTPPIPQWVMGAGSRSSWSDYNNRKSKMDSDSTHESKEEDKN
ncbi:hypothetical protein ACLX1H_005307 [Fusarium chlamydosporum]